MPDDRRHPEELSIVIDGRRVDALPDELVIACAERHGTYIPRFCWHPRMKPVGMCRMCLVEVEGVRGLPPACTLPVADGMVVDTQSPAVVGAQEAVLEFLLINHPIDCPVCDRGGECPLQDQTMSFGPGESRFVEEKRHWEKPITLGPAVQLDRERCIQCARCTRFCDEIAGEAQLDFLERGARTEVGIHPGQPFTSYFSGNTVQICPVGALLEAPYRFRARPWDLDQAESTCTVCAVGCRMVLQSSMDEIVRHVGVDADVVNQGWLCDKGRFSHQALGSGARLRQPLVRRDGELAPAGWGEALQTLARGLQSALGHHGPERIGFIGGARLPNEDAYAWTKLAKGVLGTDNVDAQLADGLPAPLVLSLPRATIDDACAARTVIVLAPDLRETLPVLFLRLRGAVLDRGVRLLEITPATTALSPYADISIGYRPGDAEAAVADALAAMGADNGRADPAEGDVVVVLGRPSLAGNGGDLDGAVTRLARELPHASFLTALPRGNVHGALDMGMAPGIAPGRVAIVDAPATLRGRWPTLPEAPGLDTAAMLQAAADGRLDVLVLLGADPLDDVPDRMLAERALDTVPFLAATDTFLTASSRRADVVLAAAAFGERDGTTTNLEGRVTRLAHKVTPPGTARPDWIIAADVAWQLGTDLGVESLDELWDEITAVAPTHHGLHGALLADGRYRDGLVPPLDGTPAPSRRPFGDIATDLYLSGAEQTPSRRFASEPGLGPQPVTVTSRRSAAPPTRRGSEVPGAGAAPISTPVPADPEARAEPEVAAASASQPEGAQAFADMEAQARAALADPGSGVQSATGYRRARSARTRDHVDVEIEVDTSEPGPATPLTVVATRSLFAGGTVIDHSPALAERVPAPAARLHPDDAAARALAPGDIVIVRAADAAVTLPLAVEPGVVRGTVALPLGHADVPTADLLEADDLATRAIVEREDPR